MFQSRQGDKENQVLLKLKCAGCSEQGKKYHSCFTIQKIWHKLMHLSLYRLLSQCHGYSVIPYLKLNFSLQKLPYVPKTC